MFCGGNLLCWQVPRLEALAQELILALPPKPGRGHQKVSASAAPGDPHPMKPRTLYSLLVIGAMYTTTGCTNTCSSTINRDQDSLEGASSGATGGAAGSEMQGGEAGSGATTTSTSSSSESTKSCVCDDGNYCTVDVCVAGECLYLGYSGPHECSSTIGVGLCIWGECAIVNCADGVDGDKCFLVGEVGTCSGGVCIKPI